MANKAKSGYVAGSLAFPSSTHSISDSKSPRIAFVPQQDVLPPTLTVREALMFSAALRLPESVSKVEKAARVEEVLDQLGLLKVANSRIGDKGKRGVSGGEMRRVSIGLELVGNPDILVLDEPTSGLDSVSAARVASVLKDVAKGGKLNSGRGTAVVCSIHQPRFVPYPASNAIVWFTDLLFDCSAQGFTIHLTKLSFWLMVGHYTLVQAEWHRQIISLMLVVVL